MRKLEAPNGLTINFAPSPKQYTVWKALQGNFCDKCGGELELKVTGHDKYGHPIHEAVCSKCGNTDIPELVLAGGSAGGGKSHLGCAWVISSCMKYPGIRMVLARLELKNLLATTWNTMLNILKDWGLEQDVHFHINNQRMIVTFWNGSTIQGMELTPRLNDPDWNFLGSLEITGAFIDEVSEIMEKAVEVLQSRIRYRIAESFKVGKMLLSTNPCTTWVRSTFVQDDDGNPIKLPKGLRYLPFSLFDNPNESFRMIYFNRLRKIRDKATRQRLLYGNWDFVDDLKMAAYHKFNGEEMLVQGLFEHKYNPLNPIILSLDFNVNPYMTALMIQFDWERKEAYVLKEMIGRPDEKINNTPAFSRFIVQQLREMNHIGSICITGDPAGASRSTQTEAGVNNFTIIEKALSESNIRSVLQIFNTQPAQISRLDFINELFGGLDGWKVFFDLRCRKLAEDMNYQRKNPDGTKEKKKVLMEDGTRAEKYGHASDCLDYALTYYLNKEYNKFIHGEAEIVTTIDSGGDVYGTFLY